MDSAYTMVPTEMEMLKRLEDEHFRLQRQVRVIQNDRSNQASGAQPQFRTQNQQLNTLKVEYINLNKDLKIAKSGAHKKKDKRMASNLKSALLRRLQTLTESEGGVRLMDELEGLLQRNNKNVINMRKRVTETAGKLEERRNQSVKSLASMENKLEVATLRFNSVKYENQKIRHEIEHMLKDRVVFNQAWCRMLSSLSKGKKFLLDLFEQSTLAYDQRDECCGKLRSMQEKGRVDQMLQMQEMRDLQKVLDHDSRLHHFLAKKSVMRINKHEERRVEEIKKRQEEELLNDLEQNRKVVDDIHNYTQEDDVDKIIEDFETKEVYNFSIYNLLTDVSAETIVLNKAVNDVRREVVDRRDWNEAKRLKQEGTLEKLREELSSQIEKNESLRAKIAEHDDTLHRFEEEIQELFKMLECDDEPFQNLLGDKKPSLQLMNLTFTLIADKIRTYMQYIYYTERTAKKKATGVTSSLKKYTIYAQPPECWDPTPINLLVPADPCPQCIEARWLSRIVDKLETPFVGNAASEAADILASETAYERSDRIHPLAECRLPRSRMILARRYM